MRSINIFSCLVSMLIVMILISACQKTGPVQEVQKQEPVKTPRQVQQTKQEQIQETPEAAPAVAPVGGNEKFSSEQPEIEGAETKKKNVRLRRKTEVGVETTGAAGLKAGPDEDIDKK